jgi:hypothetical protein
MQTRRDIDDGQHDARDRTRRLLAASPLLDDEESRELVRDRTELGSLQGLCASKFGSQQLEPAGSHARASFVHFLPDRLQLVRNELGIGPEEATHSIHRRKLHVLDHRQHRIAVARVLSERLFARAHQAQCCPHCHDDQSWVHFRLL